MCIKKSVINTGSAHLILQIRYPINKLGRSWDLAEATVDDQSLSSLNGLAAARPLPETAANLPQVPSAHHLKYIAMYMYISTKGLVGNFSKVSLFFC